jgi:hypothetical protein
MFTRKEPDLALAGLALLIIFGFMIWHDKPIKIDRPLESYNNQQDRQIKGHSYESWLWEDPFEFNPEIQNIIQCDKQIHNSISQLPRSKPVSGVNNAEENGKNLPVILTLPVTIHPNTLDNKERRSRDRYAVIAGLLESGYTPHYEPARMNFCSSKNKGTQFKNHDVRWESFKHKDKDKENTNPEIIVVWADSDTICKLEKDLSNKSINCNSNKDRIRRLKRANDNDKELADKLSKELKENRRISEFSEIAIITEQNSDESNNLAKAFYNEFSNGNSDNSPKNGEAKKENSFFYLKGLDSYQPVIENHRSNNKTQSSTQWEQRYSIIDQHNPPIGSAQFDYLQRLAEQIKKTHKDPDPRKRIKAVGVFGSEFYDKLIIFQALRREMPNIVLFTTDLDAQMFHLNHWRWTRNLIVASHFDLKLGKTNQSQFPPFRDSLQTALFVETKRCIEKINCNDQSQNEKSNNSPFIFEIGRNGPVHLKDTQDAQKTGSIHLFDDYSNTKHLNETFWVLAVTSVILILTLQQILPHSGRLIIWLLLTTGFAFYFTSEAITDKGEPFSFTDGVSLWPTILLRFLSCSLAIAFICNAICQLENNFERLNNRFFKSKKLKILCADCNHESFAWFEIIFCLSFLLLGGILYWWYIQLSSPEKIYIFWSILVLFLFIVLFMHKKSFNQRVINSIDGFKAMLLNGAIIILLLISAFFLDEKNILLPINFLWLILLLVFYLFYITISDDFKSIIDWRENDSSKTPKETEKFCYQSITTAHDTLWSEYHAHGRLHQRMLRVTAMWLLFITIAALLYYLLPDWPAPHRGNKNGYGLFWQVASFAVIMVLTFLVLDALRLCYYWIQKLHTKLDELSTRGSTAGYYYFDTEINSTSKLLEEIVILVAKRTRVIDKLIYYPLLTIMLMLFASISYFDNQDFPRSMGITFAASITLLIFAGFKLRTEADRLKFKVIQCLENLSHEKGHLVQQQVDKAIQNINTISYGAFQSMQEQPVMRTLLLILASLGLFAGEYLKMFG